MPTFNLDGQPVPFEPGDTIIRAAHRVGIDIPHYCWHPGLSVAANCRMCLVELAPPPGRPAMMLDVLHYDTDKGEYVRSRKPKLVPACQQTAMEGMEVSSQTSPHVRQTRAAVQEFLLLNHPVDCPICDQAGECRLQDYWLSTARSKKRMNDEPVHKPKAVSFGPTIVYDAERCIVCTRCVRVCNELAKDPVLSVRERGNLNEIVLAPGRQLDHNYSLMTEHVCPVGALTSKDFRFKARVWFLRSARTVCMGCSRGCNSFMDYDPRSNEVLRVRPRQNLDVNQYWMCDRGMLDYQNVGRARVLEAKVKGSSATVDAALAEAAAVLRDAAPKKIALVLGSQFSQEDNFLLLELGRQAFPGSAHFFSGAADGQGDEILMNAERNPNRKGIAALCSGELPQGFDALGAAIEAGMITHVLALGAEISGSGREGALGKSGLRVITLAAHDGPLARRASVLLPASSYAEYSGTYVNVAGLEQRSEKAIPPLGSSRPAWKLIADLARALDKPFEFANLAAVRRRISEQPASKLAAEQGAGASA